MRIQYAPYFADKAVTGLNSDFGPFSFSRYLFFLFAATRLKCRLEKPAKSLNCNSTRSLVLFGDHLEEWDPQDSSCRVGSIQRL